MDPDRPRFLLIDFQRGRDGDADHFIEGFSVDPGPYEKIGKIESISIDGRPAKRFVVNQARRQLHGPLVPGEENVDYVVIPVEKGYFVLSYTAHINDFQKGRPAFEHLLQTFHHPAKAAK